MHSIEMIPNAPLLMPQRDRLKSSSGQDYHHFGFVYIDGLNLNQLVKGPPLFYSKLIKSGQFTRQGFPLHIIVSRQVVLYISHGIPFKFLLFLLPLCVCEKRIYWLYCIFFVNTEIDLLIVNAELSKNIIIISPIISESSFSWPYIYIIFYELCKIRLKVSFTCTFAFCGK